MSTVQDQLQQLRERIDQLEQELTNQGSDNLAPNYLTLDANGNVGANFTGTIDATDLILHGVVNAYGLLLPTYLTSGTQPASESFVKWQDATNGKLGGGLVVEYQTGAPNTMYAVTQANAEQAGDTSQVNLQARDDTDTQQASLNVTQQNRGATANVNAWAGAHGRTLVTETGDSSFLLKPQQVTLTNVAIPAGSNQNWNIGFTPGPTGGFDANIFPSADTGYLSGFQWHGYVSGGSTFALTLYNPAGATATGSLVITIYVW